MNDQSFSRTLGKDDVYLVRTLDGSDTLYSRSFGSTYHSINGAVSESRHVFIQHGLTTLEGKLRINILEIGFGTGLNAFLACLFSRTTGREVYYTGIEAYPLDLSVVSQLNYPSYLAADQSRVLFIKIHEVKRFHEGSFHFSLLTTLDQITSGEKFDCIFFDAFAPKEHPEIWEQETFDTLFKLMAPEGIMVTYCAQGEVRRRMQQAGFTIERLPGAPGKREMLRAQKPL